MKTTKLLCWFAVFVLVLAAQEPQGALTNVRVANLVRLGVSTPEIIRIISSAPQVSFDLRPGSTDNLLKAGISEEIVSGGSNRDDLPFEGQHVAPRTWTITLNGLKPGEYGLLPPGAIEARSASAQLGKMYTFTVVE